MFFFFKQKAAYEMRISDWSSDVCSSDLISDRAAQRPAIAVGDRYLRARFGQRLGRRQPDPLRAARDKGGASIEAQHFQIHRPIPVRRRRRASPVRGPPHPASSDTPFDHLRRSEEHTSALQSLMRISYAVYRWK